MSRLTRRLACLVALAACGGTPSHLVPIAVIADGDHSAIGALPGATDGLELQSIELPPPSPPPRDDSSPVVTQARSAYASGDFDACRVAVASLDLAALLATEQRSLAARALALDAACAWGATNKTAALASAARLAAFGLELPDVAVSPDVERVLGDAIRAAGNGTRARLAIAGVAGSRVSIDGRSAGCTLPCALDLVPGDHVVALALDGFAPTWRIVHVPDTASVTIEQKRADPALAAQQWRTRVGRGLPPIDATGALLLGTFAGERVAYLMGDHELSGTLVLHDALAAHLTRARGQGAALVRELAYDGGVLHRPSIVQRPWFWIAATATAIALAGAVVALTYQPPVHVMVGF
jgi:hypothetical protein